MFDLGDVIGGKYCLEQKIGEGGMASIWRAVHMDLDRPVAVKFVSAVGDQTKIAERFLREARVAAAVRHRNVVDIIDFGTTRGQPYMVMELLEGEELADRITREPPLKVADLIEIIAATLKGLAAVHAAGIVHRDIKPENIFLVRDSDDTVFPKLLDFGISRAVGSDTLRSAVQTKDGMLTGTPHYMSPEQARGLPDIDARTDIYAMGVVLYEGLTGELPFDSEFVGDIIIKISTTSPVSVAVLRPELGQPLSDVIERCMAREPDARYPDAIALRGALLAAAEQTAALTTSWTSTTTRANTEMKWQSERPPRDVGGEALSEAMRARSDTESVLPRPRARRRPGVWMALGVAALGAALGVWLIGPGSDAAIGDATGDAPDAVAHAQTEVPIEGEDEPSPTVTVQLRGLPDDATVSIDGELASGSRLELPRSDALQTIEVTADGYERWRMGHRATDDGAYDVELVPLPAVAEATSGQPAAEEEPPVTARRRRRSRRRGGRSATRFNDPGF